MLDLIQSHIDALKKEKDDLIAASKQKMEELNAEAQMVQQALVDLQNSHNTRVFGIDGALKELEDILEKAKQQIAAVRPESQTLTDAAQPTNEPPSDTQCEAESTPATASDAPVELSTDTKD